MVARIALNWGTGGSGVLVADEPVHATKMARPVMLANLQGRLVRVFAMDSTRLIQEK